MPLPGTSPLDRREGASPFFAQNLQFFHSCRQSAHYNRKHGPAYLSGPETRLLYLSLIHILINTLRQSFQIGAAVTGNTLIYWCQRLPLVGKLFKDRLYACLLYTSRCV